MLGRVRQAREIGRRRRHADADEADVVVLERARGRDGHHFVGLVIGHRSHSAAARCFARILGEGLGAFLQHVFLHPGEEAVALARDPVPLLVEAVVARVIALRIGREGAARHLDHMADGPVRQHHRVEAALRQFVDDLFHRHDRALGGEHRFLLHAEHAFDHDVAGLVGALRVDHRHVRTVRRNGGELLAGERAGDVFDVRIDLGQVAADIAAEHRKRQTRGARLIGVGHGGVRVLDDLELMRPAVLDRSRGSGAASRRPDCRPTRRSSCRRSPCR